jgi:hypothetical protein
MPHEKVARMSGVHTGNVGHGVDHHPQFAGMNEPDMRAFLKEEQAEGMHPSLKGKRF